MYVKKLDLLGFKTFAERTQIELGEGITAIVGPNGSGKSNIADAFQWVLGESNIRNLRGQRVTDVIFNGSERRRSHGLAEVSLALDNSDRKLPLDFAEVTVTRRAFRSGESEYLINNTRCRLKDIYELFLDTGLGREAYSVISQGEIDAVLSAKPEDRRELFEEAAGIRKYRYRREEAIRKLERTEANLRRVCDIMAEVGAQVEPVAEQAELAKRYAELQSRLWDIEIGLLIRDLKRCTANYEEVKAAQSDFGAKISELDARIGCLEQLRDQKAAQLAKLDEESETARRVHQTLSATVQRLESRMALSAERLKSVEANRIRAEEECGALEVRIRDSVARIENLKCEIGQSSEAESQVRSQAASLEKQICELDQSLSHTLESINGRRVGHLELARELSAKQTGLRHWKERAAELEFVIGRLDSQIKQLADDRADCHKKLESARAEVSALAKKIADTEAGECELRDRHAETSRKIEACVEDKLAAEKQIASMCSRLKTLQEMQEAREGISQGVRSLLEAHKGGTLGGDFRVFADLITVAKGCEIAVEAALGPSTNCIVASSTHEAADALEYLKSNQFGKATILPLDRIRNSSRLSGLTAGKRGVVDIASNLVKCESWVRPAVEVLLGGTVVTETFADALELASRVKGWEKVVTLQGETLLHSGAISGGDSKNKSQSIILRKAQMESLGNDIAQAEKSALGITQNLDKLRSEAARLNSELSGVVRSLSDMRMALGDSRKSVQMHTENEERLRVRIDQVEADKADAISVRDQSLADAERLRTELELAGHEDEEIDQGVAVEEKRAQEVREALEIKRSELMRLNIEAAGLAEHTSTLKSALEDSIGFLAESKAGLESRKSQLESFSSHISALGSDQSLAVEEHSRQQQLFAASTQALDDITHRRTSVLSELAATESDIKAANVERKRCAEAAHDADIKEARLEVQLAQIRERLLTEYELTFDKAMEWPEDELQVERGTASEVARLRKELRDMGPVNTGAVHEYDRLKERWDFLSTQRSDLESAKAQVNVAICEIDSKTHGLFMETFGGVAREFDAMFRHLFGGGRAELSLTDPKDPLESGVEVAVQPPGKKLQDLALLSGGERALTAAALVFALLRMKPSPFVLLDEVDAPLDESNVERFADVLKEFSSESQFVVITHNRATMEASGSLYGVTMEEPGISKLISVRIAGEGPADRELDAAALA